MKKVGICKAFYSEINDLVDSYYAQPVFIKQKVILNRLYVKLNKAFRLTIMKTKRGLFDMNSIAHNGASDIVMKMFQGKVQKHITNYYIELKIRHFANGYSKNGHDHPKRKKHISISDFLDEPESDSEYSQNVPRQLSTSDMTDSAIQLEDVISRMYDSAVRYCPDTNVAGMVANIVITSRLLGIEQYRDKEVGRLCSAVSLQVLSEVVDEKT